MVIVEWCVLLRCVVLRCAWCVLHILSCVVVDVVVCVLCLC